MTDQFSSRSVFSFSFGALSLTHLICQSSEVSQLPALSPHTAESGLCWLLCPSMDVFKCNTCLFVLSKVGDKHVQSDVRTHRQSVLQVLDLRPRLSTTDREIYFQTELRLQTSRQQDQSVLRQQTLLLDYRSSSRVPPVGSPIYIFWPPDCETPRLWLFICVSHMVP